MIKFRNFYGQKQSIMNKIYKILYKQEHNKHYKIINRIFPFLNLKF